MVLLKRITVLALMINLFASSAYSTTEKQDFTDTPGLRQAWSHLKDMNNFYEENQPKINLILETAASVTGKPEFIIADKVLDAFDEVHEEATKNVNWKAVTLKQGFASTYWWPFMEPMILNTSKLFSTIRGNFLSYPANAYLGIKNLLTNLLTKKTIK